MDERHNLCTVNKGDIMYWFVWSAPVKEWSWWCRSLDQGIFVGFSDMFGWNSAILTIHCINKSYVIFSVLFASTLAGKWCHYFGQNVCWVIKILTESNFAVNF